MSMRRFSGLVLVLGLASGCGDSGADDELADAGTDSTTETTDSTATESTTTDGTDTTDTTESTTVDPEDDCVSDSFWTFGNMGSQFMHPGRDCLDCHQNFNEIPGLVLAGTVYTNAHELDECNGAEGVLVTITDSTGAQFQTGTNSAGNFGLFNVNIVTPYTATLDWQGRTRAMVGMQTSKSCNECHTVNGAQNAPGRIQAP